MTCRVLKLARQPYYRWRADPVTGDELAEARLANAATNIRKAARTTLPRPSGSELCGRTSANARRSGAHKASRERTQKSESSNGPAASTTKTEAAA